MTEIASSPTPGWFRIVAILGLLWNALGVVSYFMHVTMSEASLAAMPAAERALFESFPVWVTGAFAIAVFGGLAGALGLVLRKRWSVPLLGLSLLAILFQFGYTLFVSDMLAVMGAGAAVLPVMIIVVGAALLWLARTASTRGWLN
jgi:hypothetical protein